MEVIKTSLDGVLIIEPKVFGDNRGWFTETYSKKVLEEGESAWKGKNLLGKLLTKLRDEHLDTNTTQCNHTD